MSPNSHQVHITKQGTIQGALDPTKRVVRFLNVPYGTAPQRWRPPVKPEPWSGVRDATKQGPIAPQARKDARYSGGINTYSGIDFDEESVVFDERDCLNLNIYVHEDTLARAGENRDGQEQGAAVMVYVHGGAFRDGANAMDIYDGSNLVRLSAKIGRPVIVVVMNYRLNFLGFFSSPEMVADLKSDKSLLNEYDRSAGNWGLMDQRLAFEWVHAHIGSFGGRADNITAFGESVGAVSINYHMLISQHRGLFHRAIMQSCAMASAPAIRPDVEGKLYFDALVDHFNIPSELSGKEKLERLRNVSAVELCRATGLPKFRMFTPYIDGTIVPQDVRLWVHMTERYDHGVKAVIVGDTKDEASMFPGNLGATTVAAWPRIVEKYCPPNKTSRDAWDKIYGRIESDEDALKASVKVIEHSLFTYPDFSALRALSKRKDLGSHDGFELFQYYFDRSIAAVDAKGQGLGAHHGVDMVYVFAPDLALDEVFTEEEKRFSEQVRTTWILFAHGETLNKEHFPARITRPVDDYGYHATEKEAIVFSKDLKIDRDRVNRQGEAVLKFWEESERWVHETRELKKDSEEGLRAGLLCIALPSQKDWS
ncbi:hypothetical protein BGZ99_004299 [Dissophora globulifera]|uniref:Carboxylesterase type B domain-containing protein n=1 Tax=Dissophora globulifera TaxID=979702 RepID=A0A9P6RKU0_9FUNG|nr:hypothetical protein BGZ99_004299 [Dissophora globulifera]